MFALYLLLPLLASVTLAAPAQNRVDLDPRQRRPGGTRGSRVRPGSTQAAATTAAAAPVAPASSAAPAADATGGNAVESPAPVVSATSAVADASGESTAAGSAVSSPPVDTATADAPADPTGAAVTGTEAAASSSAPAASASGATSTDSSSSSGAGSGPVGTGWDKTKNLGSISSYVDAGLQWWTNWSPQAEEYPAIEFVPMVWGNGSVPELKGAMGGWPAGTKYVLSFNERESTLLWNEDLD